MLHNVSKYNLRPLCIASYAESRWILTLEYFAEAAEGLCGPDNGRELVPSLWCQNTEELWLWWSAFTFRYPTSSWISWAEWPTLGGRQFHWPPCRPVYHRLEYDTSCYKWAFTRALGRSGSASMLPMSRRDMTMKHGFHWTMKQDVPKRGRKHVLIKV